MVSAFSDSSMLLAQAGESGLGAFALVVMALASVVAAGSLAYGVFVLYARQIQLMEKDTRVRAARAQREADAPPPPAPVFNVPAAPAAPAAAPAAPAPQAPPIVITIPVPMQPTGPQAPLSAQPVSTAGSQPLPPRLVAVLTAAVAVAVGRPFVIKQITPLPSMSVPLSVSTWKERGRLNIHDSHSPRKRSR